jgi:hypothetical protein
MGNRRMGAQRLQSLLKRGAQGLDLTYQAGAGIRDAVVSHKVIKNGGVIETQILIDLQGKSGSIIHSADTDQDMIGATTDASDEAAALAAAVADASVMTWENDVHGIIFESEVSIIEAPVGGANDIDVVFATKDAAFKLGTAVGSLTVAATLYAPGAALTVGDRVYLPVMDEDLDNANPEQVEIRWPNGTFADLDGKALYLLGADGNPGAQYTAGKILITLRGLDTSWGF